MNAAANSTAPPFSGHWSRPQTRVGRIALRIAVLVLGCAMARLVLGHGTAGKFFAAAVGLGLLALAPFALILAIRLLNGRLLWKVRNRLIVTYVLMGLAPVVLFATLTAIAAYICAGQFSINSALAGMDEAGNQVRSEASEIGGVLTRPGAQAPGQPLQFEQRGNPRERDISLATLQNGVWKNQPLMTGRGRPPASPFEGAVSPGWLHSGYRGVVVWQGKLYLCRVATVSEDQRSTVVLAALELNQAALTSIGRSLGRVLLFSGTTGEHRVEIDNAEREAESAEQQADLAETQRAVQQQLAAAERDRAQAQRDSAEQVQEALREARRDQEQAQRQAAAEVREAQREVERAAAEAARLRGTGQDSSEDRRDAQQALDGAQRQLSEAQAEASQAIQTAPVAVPPVAVPPVAVPPVAVPPAVPPVAVPPAVPPPTALPSPVPVPHSVAPARLPRGSRAPTPPAERTPRPPAGKSAAGVAPNAPAQPRSGGDGSFTAVSGGAVPTPASFFNPRVYFTAPFPLNEWQDGRQSSAVLVVISRPNALYARLFSTSVEMGSVLRNVLVAIAVGFAILELIAFWMATRLSGTITHSVADLYQGTTEIDKGNLNYRVKLQRPDQLGALAGSFNRMAGSIQGLLVQQRESDRVLNELAIAQEVQQNLFPHSPVSLAGLELHAVCLPARTVSGDYFDFIFGHNTLGRGTAACIALGDISGKGISAALLMATLHSAVRAFSLREGGGLPSPARQLELLNQHLFASTQSNRYATLFLAFYDARTRKLTYANGGHLPPFLISADGVVRRLDVGGSVVGLLEDVQYQEASVELQPGDLLVAFTDGVTEPENQAEQEFGEARLLSLLEQHRADPLPQLADAVAEAVKAWIAGQEQPDDMTLLLARAR